MASAITSDRSRFRFAKSKPSTSSVAGNCGCGRRIPGLERDTFYVDFRDSGAVVLGSLLKPVLVIASESGIADTSVRKSRLRLRGPARAAKRDIVCSPTNRLAWPLLVFLPSLIIPWIISIGPLRLTMYRFVLLGLFITVVIKWAKEQATRSLLADVAFLAFCAWCILSMLVIHGTSIALQTGGILFIETMVPYLMGRCYVRNADDYYRALRLLLFIVVLLLPFALLEVTTGAKPLIKLFGAVFPAVEITMMQPRMGLWRTQGPFEHSILFGAVCGSIVAGVYLVVGRGRSFLSRCIMTGAVVLTGLCALSSAPIAGMIVQLFLIGWNSLLKAVKARWLILTAIALAMTATIALGSNQGVIRWYISHFTFDGQTGWFRLLIWELGTESVRNYPLFGIGFNEWARPSWMPGSIDNFWLLLAVRHGLPAPLLFFLPFACLYGAAVRRGGLDEAATACKLAYLICLTSFFFVSWTVHFLNAPYVLYMFILGSGAWIGMAPQNSSRIRDPARVAARNVAQGSATRRIIPAG